MENSLTASSSVLISNSFIWRSISKIFWLLSFILITALLFSYIFQINALIKETHLLQNYEKNIYNLSRENQNLEINFSKLNSLVSLEKEVQNLNLEKVNQVKYIRVLEGQVAKTFQVSQP